MKKVKKMSLFLFPILLAASCHWPSALSAFKEPVPQKNKHGNYGEELPQHAVARLGRARSREILENITAFFMLPDGRRILTRTKSGNFRIWDASDGREIDNFSDAIGNGDPGTCSLSKDGRYLAMAGGSGLASVRVRNLSERRFIKIPDLPKHWYSVAISANGALLGIGGGDRLTIVNVKTSELIWESDRIRGVCILAFSSDEKTLITADSAPDRRSKTWLRLWDARNGKEIGKLEGLIGDVRVLDFSPDGKRIASLTLDNILRIWDVSSRRELHRVSVPKCLHLAFSPDSKLIASCGGDARIRIWDTETLHLHRVLGATGNALHCIAFSPDGKSVIAGGDGYAIHFLDVAKGQATIPFVGHHAAVNTVRFSPNGKLLASWGSDQTVRLWDLQTYRQRWTVQIGEGDILSPHFFLYSANRLAFSPDNHIIASVAGTKDGKGVPTIHLMDTASGARQISIQEQDVPIKSAAPSIAILGYTPDGAALATYTSKSMTFWSSDSGRLLRRLPRITGSSFALSPDGRTLVTASDRLRYYSLSTGMLCRSSEDGTANLAVTFSHDGAMFAYHAWTNNTVSHDRDYTVVIRESATGGIIQSIRLFSSLRYDQQVGITSLAISPCAPLLAAGCDLDSSIRVLDLIRGRQIARFKGHKGPVLSVDFSPDGKLLASASADTTILLWDVSHLQAKRQPPVPRHEFSEGIARLWEELRANDAGKAYQAIWRLTGAGDDAVAFLGKKLRPASVPDPKGVQLWIADLDSDDFAKREAATECLTKFCELVEPALRQALRAKPSLEARKRMENILTVIDERAVFEREPRPLRALHALELIGSPAARELLKKLAGGASGARLTRDAKLALQRLERRTHKP